jgi:hypothetical protein
VQVFNSFFKKQTDDQKHLPFDKENLLRFPPFENWSLPTHNTVGETYGNPKGNNYLVFLESRISRREKAI